MKRAYKTCNFRRDSLERIKLCNTIKKMVREFTDDE